MHDIGKKFTCGPPVSPVFVPQSHTDSAKSQDTRPVTSQVGMDVHYVLVHLNH